MKIKKILITAITIIANVVITQAQNVNIPDTIFKSALVNNASINTNMDTEIQLAEAAAYYGDMYLSGLGITDLTGIEAFSELTSLYCHNNQLTSLDLTGAVSLTSLYCPNNQLTSITLTGAASLYYLYCKNNLLTSIDLTGAQGLTYLYCQNNLLTSLNLTEGSAITTLNCESNQLTTLTLSAATGLDKLDCSYNLLTSIDVSNNINLGYFWCNNNLLTSLDVTNNVNLGRLYCYNNQLAYLNLSNAVLFIFCFNNQLTSLNLKNHIYFGFLNAENNLNLSCIEVDDPITSSLYWSYSIPSSTYFTENCEATGIDNTPIDNTLMAYPNPTTGSIYLSEPANITLSDLSGKLLLEQKNTNQLDISGFPAGMYFLHFGENNQHTFKVIKE